MKRAPKYLSILVALLAFAGILKATLPPIVIGSWTPTAGLSQPRANAAAVMLSDGSTLFIGGDNGSGPLQSSEAFSPNGVVSSAGLMNVARSRHFAVLLSDGRVLVGGGVASGGGTTNSAELYDPNAGSWTPTSPMTSPRANATAALLQDGRVLIAGGDNAGVPNNTIEIFDPAAASFSFAGTMSSPRTQHAMAVLQDGRVLIVGGFDGTNPLASSEIFDPASGSVSAGPSLATARYLLSATTMLNGQVAVIGGAGNNGSGATDVASIEIFDPSSGTFTTSTAALSGGREGHLAFLLPNNNSLLIVGGTSSGTAISSAELVIPQVSTSDGSWSLASSAAASLSTARSGASGAANQLNGPTSVVQKNGFVVVGGGADAAGNAVASTEAYGFPTVQTDASDYAPGSTVTVTGSGFQPGETVDITLVESPLIDTHGPYTVTADGRGNFSDTSFMTDIHDLNVRFYLTVAGRQSGLIAQNSFTDSITTVGSLAAYSNTTCPAGVTGPYVAGNAVTGCASSITFSQQGNNNFSLQIVDPSNNPVACSGSLAVGGTSPNGKASFAFNGSAITAAGTWTLKAFQNTNCSGSLASGTNSANFVVTAGAAAKYLVTSANNSPQAGTAVTITAQLADSFGNPVSTSGKTVNWSSTNGGSFSSPSTVTGASGIATVQFTTSAVAGTVHTVTATDTSSFTGTSPSITTQAGTGTKLVYGTQPSNTAAGAAIAPAVTVQVEDANNNIVTGSTAAVTIAIGTNPGGGTLSGTKTVNAVNGVATFSTLSIDKAGTGYTLTATGNSLTSATSNTFDISAGAASKLVFLQQPSNTAATQTITPAVTVQVEDANNNLVSTSTASVSVAIGTNPNSGTLSGTKTVNAVNGVATFGTLSIDKVGTGYTLSASSTGFTGASSNLFNVTAGAATQLAFIQQPTNAVAGANISPAVTVQVEDAGGNIVTSSNASITLAIGTNAGGGTLAGTLTQSAANGVATFANLSINKTGTGYTLAASSTGLTGATSSLFNITPGTLDHFAIATISSPQSAGTAFNVTITAQDINNNTVTSFNGNGFKAVLTSTGALAGAPITTPSFTNGVLANQSVTITNTGTFTITATGSGNNSNVTAVSNSFSVNPGAPAKVAFSQQPTNVLINQTIVPAVTVQILDANNNLTSSTANVSVGLTGSPAGVTLGGTTAVAAVAGVATFSNLSLNKAGTYTLSASSGVLTGATSASFTVNNPAPTLTSILPTSGNLGQTLDVVFTGTNFVTGVSTVNFGADITVNTITINSPTQITANITIPTTANLGAHSATVTNPAPGGGTSAAQTFTVNNPVTTTVVTTSGSPSTFGQSVTFTATVTSPAGTPTGSVNFFDGGSCSAPGTALGSSPLNGSGVGSLSISTLNSGAHTVVACYPQTGIFQPSGSSVAQQVNKANANISVTGYSVTYDGSAHTATGTATGVGAIDLSAGLNLASTIHTSAATYNDTWTFTDTTGNYNNANGNVQDVIGQATATIAVVPYNLTYDGNPHSATGTAVGLGGVDLSADLNLVNTVHTTAGTYNDLWAFSDPSGNYAPAGGTISDIIQQASPTLTWNTPSAITYGTALSGTQLDATANIPGTFAYNPPAGTVLTAGAHQPMVVLFTPTDSVDYKTQNANVSIDVNPASPRIIWQNPADISYPATLGSTQLNATAPAIPLGVTAWWTADEGTGTTAQDAVGSDVATLRNGASWGAGQYNSAISLQTTNQQYVDAGNTPNLKVSGGDFSVAAWVQFNSLSGDMSIVDKMLDQNTANDNGWRLLKQSDNHFWFCVGQNINVNTCQPGWLESSTTAQTGQWYHVVAVKTSNSMSLYINGVQEATTAIGPVVDDNTGNLLIGANAKEGAYLDGMIDEVQLFNHALSATEVQNIYNGTVPGNFVYAPPSGTQLNAGNNQILSTTFNPTDGTNYNTTRKSVSINVLKGTQVITFAALPGHTFGDKPFMVSATGGGSGNPVTFTATGNCSSGGTNGSTITITGAGSCTVNADQAGDSNYNPATTVQQSFAIAKATPTVIATGGTFTFDGNAHAGSGSATGVLTPPDVLAPVDLSYVGVSGTIYGPSATAPTSAGNYTVTASFAGDSNYNSTTSTAVALTINKANPTVTATGGTFTFDGNAHAGSGSATGVLTPPDALAPVTLSYVGVSGTSYPATATAPTNAGNYTVTASFPGNGNYNPGTSTAVALTINKANPTVTATGGTFTFDGNAHAGNGSATGVLTPPDALAPVTLSYVGVSGTSYPATATAPINAGNYTVTASFAGNGNYNPGTSAAAALTINKATPLVVVSFAATPITYDGGSHPAAAVVTGVNNTVLTPADGTVTITYTPGGATAPLSAGTYTASASFTSNNPNYTDGSSTSSASLTINKATPLVAVSFAASPLTYDGGSHAATAVVTGVNNTILTSADGAVAITYTPGGSSAPVNAGSYTASATFTSSNPNYNNGSSTTSASLTINKAAATISVTPYSVTYDANPHTATGTATGVKGEALSGLDLSGTTHTYAGNYNDSWTFTDTTGNYNNTNGGVNDVIGKATPIVTVSFSPNTLTYDGYPHPAIATVKGVNNTTLTSADGAVAITYTPGGSNAPVTAGSYTASATFAAINPNYTNASSTTPASLTINKATPIVTWANPANIIYGTALSGTQLNATFTWTVAGSVVNVPGTSTYTTATNAPALGAVLMPGLGQTLNVSFTPTDTADYNPAAGNAKINVVFATGGTCNNGLASGVILQPINSDGTSVFKAGSTVPTKFVVCDAFGNSVGPIGGASIVKSYTVPRSSNGTMTGVDELQYSTTPDQYFRWDPTAQQWIFNQATGKSSNLTGSGTTYLFQITLIDGTVIKGTNLWGLPGYQYGLR